ncbi:MAG: hypothetical protein E2598_01305 [Sphingobium sp.]|nr:hypothetical protein [Sphingobium sp.]
MECSSFVGKFSLSYPIAMTKEDQTTALDVQLTELQAKIAAHQALLNEQADFFEEEARLDRADLAAKRKSADD